MEETWRPVPGAPQYEVSDHGRVRSHAWGKVRLLKPYFWTEPQSGEVHLFIELRYDSPERNGWRGPPRVRRRRKLAHMMAEAFGLR